MKIKTLIVVLMMAVFSLSCVEKKTVTLVYSDWPSAVAGTYVMKEAIEQDFDLKVELIETNAEAMWRLLADGKADAMVCAWLPSRHWQFFAKAETEIENLGPNYYGTKIGLVVPAYTEIDSVADLSNHGEEFGWKIIGVEPESGVMLRAEETIQAYGLETFDLVEGSEEEMIAALGEAMSNDQNVAVTAWMPHWIFDYWDLKLLSDNELVFGETEHIDTVVRKGLRFTQPELVAFLDSFYWEANDLDTIMEWIREGGNPQRSARKWVKQNDEKVRSWLEGNEINF